MLCLPVLIMDIKRMQFHFTKKGIQSDCNHFYSSASSAINEKAGLNYQPGFFKVSEVLSLAVNNCILHILSFIFQTYVHLVRIFIQICSRFHPSPPSKSTIIKSIKWTLHVQ